MPRICDADDIDKSSFSNGISDDIFAKIVACIRIAVPYTGMIVSTRESQKTRERVLHLGISQISGGSRTSVGGYFEAESEEENSRQFDVTDTRSLDEVVNWLMKMDYIPSFVQPVIEKAEQVTDLCLYVKVVKYRTVVYQMH